MNLNRLLGQVRGQETAQGSEYEHLGPDCVGILKCVEANKSKFRVVPVLLGTCVELRDMTYAHTLEAILSKTMRTFWCTNAKDNEVLKTLVKTKAKMFERGLFTCTVAPQHEAYETTKFPTTFPTVLSLLRFSQTAVRNVFVDWNMIEKIVMFKSGAQAAETIYNDQQFHGAIGRDMSGTTYEKRPNGEMTTVQPLNSKRSNIFNKSGVDSAGKLQRTKEKVADSKRTIKHHQESLQKYRAKQVAIEKQMATANKAGSAIRMALTQVVSTIDTLKLDQDMDSQNNSLQADLEETEKHQKELQDVVNEEKNKIARHQRSLDDINAMLEPLVKQKELIKKRIAAREGDVDKAQVVAIAFSERIEPVQRKGQRAKIRLEKDNQDLGKLAKAKEEAQQEYKKAREFALKYCKGEEVDVKGVTLADVDIRIKENEKAQVKEQKRLKQHGAETAQQMLTKAKADEIRAKHNYDDMLNKVEHLKSRSKRLKKSMKMRTKKWKE